MGRAITEEGLFELAKALLAQVIVDGRAWPCANLSLSVGGFEEGVQGNKGIGGFLVRGDDAKALQNAQPKDEATPPPAAKRRRVDDGGIARFFGSREQSRESSMGDSEHRHTMPHLAEQADENVKDTDIIQEERTHEPDPLLPPPSAQVADTAPTSVTAQDDQDPSDAYVCPRCAARMPFDEQAEHEDFHFAQDLQNEQPTPPRPVPPALKPSTARGGGSTRGKGRGRPAVAASAPEKGQKRLQFS